MLRVASMRPAPARSRSASVVASARVVYGDDDELVATVARDEVTAAETGLEQVRDVEQFRVACGVSVAFV